VGDARGTGTPDRTVETGSDAGFLERWSQRKLADRNGEAKPDTLAASTAGSVSAKQAAPDEDRNAPAQLTDADMPDIDSLDSESDFSVFMSPGVSEQLRTLALRKLFHLPAFNVTDGLNDYDQDFTSFAGLGDVVTREMQRMLKRELGSGEIAAVKTESATEAAVQGAASDESANTDTLEHTDKPGTAEQAAHSSGDSRD